MAVLHPTTPHDGCWGPSQLWPTLTSFCAQNKHENEGFFTRLTALEKEFQHVSVLLHTQGKLPTGIQQLWSSPQLLDIAQQLVGPTFAGHPVWNLRTKVWGLLGSYHAILACRYGVTVGWGCRRRSKSKPLSHGIKTSAIYRP